MNKLITIRGAKITLTFVGAGFLLIHVVLFALFWRCGVMPMAYFNVFSIAFYVASLFLVRYEKWLAFCVAVYLEVLVHMTLAVYFTGWGSGFQITIIGMFILLFFAEYVGRCLQVRYVHALPWGILGMLLYLGVYVVGLVHPAEYSLPDELQHAFQIVWAIIVFGIDMACLNAFVILSFKSEAMLSTEAWHDKLTGLPNRYYMTDFLDKMLGMQAGDTRWLAIADIDDFKVINDTYGHNCGDEVLKVLSGILESSMPDASVCRWGGEEFLIAGTTDREMGDVIEQLERLRVAVQEHGFWQGEKRLRLTITIGVAEALPGQSAVEWINRADKNLYKGKNSGKNQVVA